MLSIFCGSTTCSRQKIVQYNPSHGSNSMKKHLVHEHAIELTKYKAPMKEVEDGDGGGQQKCEKRKTIITPLAITNFFGKGTRYKNDDHAQIKIIEDLVL